MSESTTQLTQHPETANLLPGLPPEARLWIYAAARDLSDDEVARVDEALGDFLREWSSHGRDVSGEAAVIHNRFLVIGAHIPSGDISGCGIDKSARVVEEIGQALEIDWLSALYVHHQTEDGAIASVPRGTFRRMVREGAVDGSTLVYDLTVQDVRGLRAGLMLRPASQTWHARAFMISA